MKGLLMRGSNWYGELKERKSSVFDAIESHYPTLSKSQKRIADYYMHNYDQAVFMTAKKLAQKLNTSESTVVRFAVSIGYDGFPHLQEHLRDSIKNVMTTKQRLTTKKEPRSLGDNIRNSFVRDLQDIKMTLDALNVKNVEMIARKIMQAKRVFVIGNRSSKIIADYLVYYLNFFHADVHASHHGVNEIFEQLHHLTKEDMVIIVSFPRYTKRTLEVAEFVHRMGTPIFAITDAQDAPVVKFASYELYASYSFDSFIDSHVAPMSLVNALITAIAYENFEDATQRLQKLEELWKQYGTYYYG